MWEEHNNTAKTITSAYTFTTTAWLAFLMDGMKQAH
jgi:hypothetical protein